MGDQSTSKEKSVTRYGYRRAIDLPFEKAVERTVEALKGEGFGVLCEINLKEKFKEKLGIDFRNYIILGACNPPLAYQTLAEELEIGLLLPCNLIVYEEQGRSIVAAIDAAGMMAVVGNPKLEAIAGQVNGKLRRVIDSL